MSSFFENKADHPYREFIAENKKMSNLNLDEVNNFIRLVVEQAKQYPIVYKYLTFENGCLMLRYNNIQFTRGDMLNDSEDINISKFDINKPKSILEEIGIDETIIESKFNEHAETFRSFGICSFGCSPTNPVLWQRYSSNPNGQLDGICIGLNQNKVINYFIHRLNLKTACVKVRYEYETTHRISWMLKDADKAEQIFKGYQFFALKKANPWADEDEIRLLYTQVMNEPYLRFVLPKDCFEKVYYGTDMGISQKKEVGRIISQNLPKLQRIPLPIFK